MCQALTNEFVGCPYCGEIIEVLIEVLDESCEYIEDCQVCCRPIVFHIEVSVSGEHKLSTRTENDLY